MSLATRRRNAVSILGVNINRGFVRPGERSAVLRGCICPQEENHYGFGCGEFTASGDPIFWRHIKCPIHGDDLDA